MTLTSSEPVEWPTIRCPVCGLMSEAMDDFDEPPYCNGVSFTLTLSLMRDGSEPLIHRLHHLLQSMLSFASNPAACTSVSNAAAPASRISGLLLAGLGPIG
jgi:hypothetical protein